MSGSIHCPIQFNRNTNMYKHNRRGKLRKYFFGRIGQSKRKNEECVSEFLRIVNNTITITTTENRTTLN